MIRRRRTSGPTRVLTYPRDPNPYQQSLHDALARQGVRAGFLAERTPSAAVNLLLLPAELLLGRVGGARVWHLHWVFKFVPAWARGLPGGRRAGDLWFRAMLRFAAAIGYRVVWTAHNLLPHSQVFPDDRASRRALVDAADAVIVHSEQAGRDLVRELGADPVRIRVIPHGPFAPATGRATRGQVRSELGLSEGDLLLGLLGRIDPYKGVDDLLDALVRLERDGRLAPGLRVLVAGSCGDDQLAGRIRALAAVSDRVILRMGWLSDEDYSGYMTALDLAALPFRRVTTSGSAVAALSCAVPVAVPTGLLADLPGDVVVRFDDLDRLLLRLDPSAPDAVDLDRLRTSARRRLGDWTWDDVARETAATYGGEPAARTIPSTGT